MYNSIYFMKKDLDKNHTLPNYYRATATLISFSCISNLNHFTVHLMTTITQSLSGVKGKKKRKVGRESRTSNRGRVHGPKAEEHPIVWGDGRRSSLSHLEEKEMGTPGKLFMGAHTQHNSRSLSPAVWSRKASLTHPNKNFAQGFLSHLHAKLNVSRRPIASGSRKGKPEPSNDL